MSLTKNNLIDLISLSILTLVVIIAIFVFTSNFNTPWKHFSDQTQSFLKGRLDVDPLSFDKHDYVIQDGKYYWPQGPFPSVLLIPFQLFFGTKLNQGTAQLLLISILCISLFKLARLKKFNILDSLYLVIVFLLGSTLVGLIIDPKSWFFSQVTTVTTLSLLILELESSRRWWLIGVLESILIATRFTSGFIIFALIFLLYKEKRDLRRKLMNLFFLSLPIFVSGLLLVWFNYARFGNLFNNGYFTNDVGGYLSPLRDMGFFSLQHFPTNFHYYFLASVNPITSNIGVHLKFPFIKYNSWGLSLFLVAPFFLYSLRSLKKSSSYLRSLWIVVVITLFTLLIYYAPGWVQFGPRYTADFMPILYLLILNSLTPPKLTNFQKIVIVFSCLFNIYLLSSPIFFKG